MAGEILSAHVMILSGLVTSLLLVDFAVIDSIWISKDRSSIMRIRSCSCLICGSVLVSPEMLRHKDHATIGRTTNQAAENQSGL